MLRDKEPNVARSPPEGDGLHEQERFERVRWRAKQARAARHARVLSRFWHTSQGLIWQVGPANSPLGSCMSCMGNTASATDAE